MLLYIPFSKAMMVKDKEPLSYTSLLMQVNGVNLDYYAIKHNSTINDIALLMNRLYLSYAKIFKVHCDIVCSECSHWPGICYYVIFKPSTICTIKYIVWTFSIPSSTIDNISYLSPIVVIFVI